jgi:hypothetical protein
MKRRGFLASLFALPAAVAAAEKMPQQKPALGAVPIAPAPVATAPMEPIKADGCDSFTCFVSYSIGAVSSMEDRVVLSDNMRSVLKK